MFKWEGLPDTIPQRTLELNIQRRGHTTIYAKDGLLYTDVGGLGGVPNQRYMPTLSIIANPYQQFYAQLKIDEECVVIPNDDCYMGIMPLLAKYGDLLSESELSIKLAIINTRLQTIISAGDDKTKASAELYLKKIVNGEVGIIVDNAFLENSLSIHNVEATASNCLKDLIEINQYLKGSEYNELGLQALFNMKRESINSNEANLNDDAIVPLTDTMLRCRQIACEKVNNLFGTSWSVDYSSAWKDNQKEIELEQKQMETDEPEEEPKEEPEVKKEDEV